jgi:autotransporter-associated beta strand protein
MYFLQVEHSSGLVTINNFILNSAILYHAQTSISNPNYAQLGGNTFLCEGTTNIFDIAAATIGIPGGNDKIYSLQSRIWGPGNIQLGQLTENTASGTYYEFTNISNSWGGSLTLALGRVKFSNGTIPSTCPVIFNNYTDSTKLNFELSNSMEIGSLSGGNSSNGVVNTMGYILTLGRNNTSTTFAGIISGSGGITKNGTGEFTITAANIYTGATTVGTGSLIVSGSIHSGSAVTVKNGGTLKGNGTVSGTVTMESGGTIGPGLSGTTIGILNTGAYTFVAGSIYSVNLDGTTPTYDQINVTGTATLGSATLTVASIANSANGKAYIIVNATSVSGTFNGLPENSTFVVSGRTLRINYTSTQVTLTDVT